MDSWIDREIHEIHALHDRAIYFSMDSLWASFAALPCGSSDYDLAKKSGSVHPLGHRSALKSVNKFNAEELCSLASRIYTGDGPMREICDHFNI